MHCQPNAFQQTESFQGQNKHRKNIFSIVINAKFIYNEDNKSCDADCLIKLDMEIVFFFLNLNLLCWFQVD